ncbi:hypothetical protein GCM10022211_05410 [Sphingomonas humi]|uniref:Thiamine phosphate synthase/TenI domain-containing protein n=2 Tax=Sphingomonas humi TaxID=335630 RepID=A0ABP7RK06_9SPHN
MGDSLHAAIARSAAAGAGVIVRHHASDRSTRREIAADVLAAGAVLGMSRDVALAEEVGAALVHNPATQTGRIPFSLAVHDEAQARVAAARQPAFVIVSPLFDTRSHPGKPVLGEDEALRLAQMTNCPAYALGGISQAQGRELMARGWDGWAGIDAWM